ncbi:MAG: hypothetical protein HND48_10885 [Chloroflexi bacterium]|nr:hypothetical protein [Chloroflexota bacterium]
MYVCDSCGGLLDVHHDLDALKPTVTRALFRKPSRRVGRPVQLRRMAL